MIFAGIKQAERAGLVAYRKVLMSNSEPPPYLFKPGMSWILLRVTYLRRPRTQKFISWMADRIFLLGSPDLNKICLFLVDILSF